MRCSHEWDMQFCDQCYQKFEMLVGILLLLTRRRMLQFNICVRWVTEKYEVHEESVGFVEVPNITSDTLTKALHDVLVRCNLDFAKCRGQEYEQ